MKWEQQVCPTCGEPAKARAELVASQVSLLFNPDTEEYAFAGESEVIWDAQEPVVQEEGKENLWCANGHGWWTRPIKEPEGPYPYPGDVAARDAL